MFVRTGLLTQISWFSILLTYWGQILAGVREVLSVCNPNFVWACAASFVGAVPGQCRATETLCPATSCHVKWLGGKCLSPNRNPLLEA